MNGASGTACLIAAACVACERDDRFGAAPPPGSAAWSEKFLRVGAPRLLRTAQHGAGRRALRAVELATIPGVVAHWMIRKRVIDDEAQRAAAERFERLIILGAGLDALLWRCAEGARFVQHIGVDHPATQGVVRRAVKGDAAARRVALVPIDLSATPSLSALAGLTSAPRATCVMIEGVLMYLEVEQVCRVLDALRRLAPRVRVVLSFMTPGPGGLATFRPRSRLVDAWLRLRGEVMRWSLKTEDAPAFFRGLGYRVERHYAARELRGTKDRLEGEELIVVDAA